MEKIQVLATAKPVLPAFLLANVSYLARRTETVPNEMTATYSLAILFYSCTRLLCDCQVRVSRAV